MAVGGYGRRELSPYSDLDVVLLGADGYDDHQISALAARVWYPLWDDGGVNGDTSGDNGGGKVRLDHSVRTVAALRTAAADDLRVALGLLDMRHVAGDPALVLSSRAVQLADWRRDAKQRLPPLAALTRERWRRVGDLAQAAAPDLKEAHGGLRDVTVLRALLASWLVDVPTPALGRLGAELLEVRDALHETTGRHGDRLVADYRAEVAGRCGFLGVDDLHSSLLETSRGIAQLASVALRDVDWIRPAPRPVGARRPILDSLAPGVGAYRGEVVLTARAGPSRDPLLGLRAAVAAASRDLVLSDSAATRLGCELAPMPVPWPDEGRALLGQLLVCGPSLVDVWERLDRHGVVQTLVPEWARVRHLAPQSAVHRHTVDRHLVQTCVEASRAAHRVERPELLAMAALLHDLGKGGPGDHSETGAPIASGILRRMGFAEGDVEMVARLVRQHLLLVQTATSRDLEDPVTITAVASAVRDAATLDLLVALTEADALATGPQAWSRWRQQLVATLVEAVRRTLPSAPSAPSAEAPPTARFSRRVGR